MAMFMAGGTSNSGSGKNFRTSDKKPLTGDAASILDAFSDFWELVRNSSVMNDKALILKGKELIKNYCPNVLMEENRQQNQNPSAQAPITTNPQINNQNGSPTDPDPKSPSRKAGNS